MINQKTIAIVMFFAAGIASYCFLQAKPSGTASIATFFRHCFPWKRLKSHSTKVDAAIYIVSKFIQRFFSLGFAAFIASLVTYAVHMLVHTTHYHSHMKAGPITAAVLGVAIFICGDFGYFISHYLMHKVPFLWNFHKVHHSASFLTPITKERVHPVEAVIFGFFVGLFISLPAIAAVFCYNFTLIEVFSLSGMVDLISTIALLKDLQHSHFNISFGSFERIFISPLMHQVHHSAKREHWDKNLASSLAIWDWLFGTAFILPKGEELVYGLGTVEDERGDYSSILWCYLGPLVACLSMLLKFFTHLAVVKFEHAVLEIASEQAAQDGPATSDDEPGAIARRPAIWSP